MSIKLLVSSGIIPSQVETPFSPDQVSGLTLWLDADDGTTLSLNSGKIVQWNDKSGNGNHFVQGTLANAPAYAASGINAKPAASFSNASQQNMLAINNGIGIGDAQARTMFVAFIHNNSGTDSDMIGTTAGRHVDFGPFLVSQRCRIRYFEKPYDAYTDALTFVWGTPYRLRIIGSATQTLVFRNGTQLSLNLNGAQSTPTNPFSWPMGDATNQLGIGGGSAGLPARRFQGFIGEMLIYNTLLTATDANNIEAYLSSKWSI